MRTTTLLILIASTSAFTFAPPPASRGVAGRTKLFMADVAKTVPIVITGNNIEVTPALMDYVNKKLDRTLGKLSNSGAILECDVHLSVNKNPKVKNAHKAEVTTFLSGVTIRSSEESPDMYASIDLVSDRLARKLRKYKERRLSGYHGGPNIGENLAKVLEEIEDEEPDNAAPVASIEEEFLDPEGEVNITKIKSFDLSKAMSVKEAVFALDYVDHDFFVFRNDESDEVSVVYKRNAGGIGLIEPQKD